jgi:hypothetical protein
MSGIIDYFYLFPSIAAAQVSPVVSAYVGDGARAFPNIKVSTSQAQINGIDQSTGFWILISNVGAASRLSLHANCVLVCDRDSGLVLFSRLTADGTASFSFAPVPFGSRYKPFVWQSGSVLAAAAGYTQHTYSASNFSAANVDIGASYARGFNLYLSNFFGSQTPSNAVTFNADGSLSALYAGNMNLTLSSCAAIGAAPGFVGKAFGGGAFITAQIAFDPATVDMTKGWPSFWTMAAEHLCGLDIQWPGQPAGYGHFIEADIFEFIRSQTLYPKAFASTLHDWYGVWSPTAGWQVVDSDFNDGTMTQSVGTDYTQINTVGMLWIPATPTTDGSIRFFFNDSQVGPAITWKQFADQAPPPGSPWTFGVIDRQHLALIVGSASGAIKVKSIDVWQTSDANNLIN